MAERGTWPNIRERGLLSTSALLDLFEYTGEARRKIESEWRAKSIEIEHPKHGKATIRDQKPLHQGAHPFIIGMTPQKYYELLNGKTFFWVRKERLVKLLNGKAYRGRSHDVLTLDTKTLVDAHGDEITLSPINSGAFFGSGKRGAFTFKKIADHPYAELHKTRGEDAVTELVVEYAVRDIKSFTIRVEEWTEGEPSRLIWEDTRK